MFRHKDNLLRRRNRLEMDAYEIAALWLCAYRPPPYIDPPGSRRIEMEKLVFRSGLGLIVALTSLPCIALAQPTEPAPETAPPLVAPVEPLPEAAPAPAAPTMAPMTPEPAVVAPATP